MAVKPIGLSFKNNAEDLELYGWIMKHSNYSGFIKDILREAKDKEENHVSNKEEKNSNTGLINLDF